MGHTYSINNAHVVYHTGRRIIRESELERLHAYIATLARDYRVRQVLVGGTADHIHLLGDFPMDKAPADVICAIKANSSRWLRGLHSCYADFSWQQGYGYFAVSASIRPDVVRYIENQAVHHLKESAAREYERMKHLHEIAAYGEAYKV